jgi:hypothetical protein
MVVIYYGLKTETSIIPPALKWPPSRFGRAMHCGWQWLFKTYRHLKQHIGRDRRLRTEPHLAQTDFHVRASSGSYCKFILKRSWLIYFDFDPSFDFFHGRYLNFQGRCKTLSGEVCTSPQNPPLLQFKFCPYSLTENKPRHPKADVATEVSGMKFSYLNFFAYMLYEHSRNTKKINLTGPLAITVFSIISR